jgi:hypothetical protein
MNGRESQQGKTDGPQQGYVNCDYNKAVCSHPAVYECAKGHSVCSVHVILDPMCEKMGKRCMRCDACIIGLFRAEKR